MANIGELNVLLKADDQATAKLTQANSSLRTQVQQVGKQYAIMGGIIAGNTIVKCLETNDLSQLKEYQKSWKNKFGKEFEKQRISRKILERIDNKTIDSLFDTITPEMVDEISDKDDFDFHTSSIVKLLGIRKSLSTAQNIMSSELRRLLTS